MKKMRSVWLSLGLVLAAASCGSSDAPVDLELLAGDIGGRGNVDGAGAAARFSEPAAVAVDSAGTIYVADRGNGTIRKVTAAGVVTKLAATADGTGTAVRFDIPGGVAVDSAGNVYVSDLGNGTIRKITAAGVVTTLAGTAGMRGSADGTGPAARFDAPAGVAVDSAGNVYVAAGSSIIRKVTPTGTTTTIAGMAGVGEVVLGTTPRLAFPSGLAIDGDSLVISDNNAILLLRHGAR